MSRISYVNGRYYSHSKAKTHVEDRGYQFADGVYEVILIRKKTLIDEDAHLERLDRSLSSLKINFSMSRSALKQVLREVLDRNKFDNGLIYIQITRGVARRDHGFPKQSNPTIVIMARRLVVPNKTDIQKNGVSVITIRDIRWQRCDIKTISLLPNVLGKQAAREAGAAEAWQFDSEDFITEGTSTNAWIVDTDGRLVTRHIGIAILSGVTRSTLMLLAEKLGLNVDERPFSVLEAEGAKEAFFTSATSFLTPVVQINGKSLSNGKPGPISTKLFSAYIDYIGTENSGKSNA